MNTITERFILTGPNAGKTLTKRHYRFIDGVCDVTVPLDQLDSVRRYLSYYGAVPEHGPSEIFQDEAERKSGEVQSELPIRAELEASEEKTDVFSGSVDAKTDAGPQLANGGRLSLERALSLLDHHDPTHWTTDGRPNCNVLGRLVGRPVSRKEVETVAAGMVRR